MNSQFDPFDYKDCLRMSALAMYSSSLEREPWSQNPGPKIDKKRIGGKRSPVPNITTGFGILTDDVLSVNGTIQIMTLLTKRNRLSGIEPATTTIGGGEGDYEDEKVSRHPRRSFRLVLVFVSIVVTIWGWTPTDNKQIPDHLRTSDSSLIFQIDSGVELSFQLDGFQSDDSNVVSSGKQHKAILTLTKSCPSPRLWLRIEGDVLAAIILYETKGNVWEGTFAIPIPGVFSLVAYWYGCTDTEQTLKQRIPLINVTTKDAAIYDASIDRPFFPRSAWLPSKGFTQLNEEPTQPYVWHSLDVLPEEANMLKTTESLVTKESATYSDTDYYRFKELSNYELVCWIGGESAELLRKSFLELRSQVNGHQRPFKFHLYTSKSFSNPDTTWGEEEKKKFRKCKHILISMDHVDDGRVPMTQTQYAEHVKNFIGHLLKAFPDDTFPIWMFTVLESPVTPTSCVQPTLPRSSHHPCNTALQDLFHTSPFPERVRLMDVTDISQPQLLGSSRPQDVVATAIALRIFVFVGKQVAEWRTNGQEGNIHGLQRGDHLEPNFELVPYLDWGK